jgi:hypothetical protein
MSRRMTNDEALDLIETVFESGIDGIATGMIDATIADMDVGRARADIDSFLAMRLGDIDPDSIQIHPDHSDETDLPMVRIIVKTEG